MLTPHETLAAADLSRDAVREVARSTDSTRPPRSRRRAGRDMQQRDRAGGAYTRRPFRFARPSGWADSSARSNVRSWNDSRDALKSARARVGRLSRRTCVRLCELARRGAVPPRGTGCSRRLRQGPRSTSRIAAAGAPTGSSPASSCRTDGPGSRARGAGIGADGRDHGHVGFRATSSIGAASCQARPPSSKSRSRWNYFREPFVKCCRRRYNATSTARDARTSRLQFVPRQEGAIAESGTHSAHRFHQPLAAITAGVGKRSTNLRPTVRRDPKNRLLHSVQVRP